MVTGKCRASFAHVFTPQAPMGGGDPKYSITLLIPKSDSKTLNEIFAEIEKAKQEGAAKVWGNRIPPNCGIPIYDGDGPRPSDGEPFGEECRGHFVLRASSKQKPGVVDMNVNPILNSGDFYSGCYVRASVNFFAYNQNGNKGVGCGLNNVQKLEEGEPLSGRTTPEEDFGSGGAYGAGAPAYGAPQQPTYGAPQQPMYGAPLPAPGNPPVSYGAQGTPYGAAPAYGAPQQPAYGSQPVSSYPAQGGYPQQPVDPITGYPMTGGVMGIS